MSPVASSVRGMKQRDLFLLSDAALLDVIDSIEPGDLERPVPVEWSGKEGLTLRDTLAAHAFDEAWVPDVLAGLSAEEVGDRWSGDLLGDDPIGSYRSIHAAATAAVNGELDARSITHLSYGDFTTAEYLEHISIYRAFQAYSIGTFLGLDVEFEPRLIELLDELVLPQVEQWRGMGIFPPEVAAPAAADAQTLLLAKTGYLKA